MPRKTTPPPAAPLVATLVHRRPRKGFSVWKTGNTFNTLCERHNTRRFSNTYQEAVEAGESRREWCDGCRNIKEPEQDKADAEVLDEIGRVIFSTKSADEKVQEIERLLLSLMD